jgi:hypothetical protein
MNKTNKKNSKAYHFLRWHFPHPSLKLDPIKLVDPPDNPQKAFFKLIIHEPLVIRQPAHMLELALCIFHPFIHHFLSLGASASQSLPQ